VCRLPQFAVPLNKCPGTIGLSFILGDEDPRVRLFAVWPWLRLIQFSPITRWRPKAAAPFPFYASVFSVGLCGFEVERVASGTFSKPTSSGRTRLNRDVLHLLVRGGRGSTGVTRNHQLPPSWRAVQAGDGFALVWGLRVRCSHPWVEWRPVETVPHLKPWGVGEDLAAAERFPPPPPRSGILRSSSDQHMCLPLQGRRSAKASTCPGWTRAAERPPP